MNTGTGFRRTAETATQQQFPALIQPIVYFKIENNPEFVEKHPFSNTFQTVSARNFYIHLLGQWDGKNLWRFLFVDLVGALFRSRQPLCIIAF